MIGLSASASDAVMAQPEITNKPNPECNLHQTGVRDMADLIDGVPFDLEFFRRIDERLGVKRRTEIFQFIQPLPPAYNAGHSGG